MTYPPKKLVKDIDSSKVQEFKESFDTSVTKVLTEGDEGYEETLVRWADNAIKKAGIVVQATRIDDIVKTINFASQNNLDFAVSCGGHSTSGSSSTEGGVLLNMRKLNKVRVDPEKKLIYVQGGAVFGEVDEESWKYGLATPSGAVSHTGVSGLTLGGGFGHLTGRHGLTIDSLMGATIVTADGKVRELSSTKNEDLFWAIRGCGINFGVVYEFIFKAHEQKDVVTGLLVFPFEKLDSVVEAFNKWLKKIHEDGDASLSICRFPPEFKPVLMASLFNNDPSEQVFRERFSEIYKVEPIIMEKVESMPYPKANTLADEVMGFGDRKGIINSTITDTHHLDVSTLREVYESYIKFTEENPTVSQSFIGIEIYDPSKFASIPSDATAFNHRFPFYNVIIYQKWLNESDDVMIYNWAKSVQKIFDKKNGKEFGYINFENFIISDLDYSEEKLIKLFGDNLPRLKELKKKYDPNVFFRKGAVIWP